MKNYCKRFDPGKIYSPVIRMLKFMNLYALFLIVGINQAMAIDSYPQKTRLSLDMTNSMVKEVLVEIEKKTEFFFLYSNEYINVERKIDVHFSNKKIDEVLEEIFRGTNVKYTIQDRQIILLPENSEENSKINTYQQTLNVTGLVKDRAGTPLPGVAVIVKGTTSGTITDIEGNYSLTDVPTNATLVYSFIGMRTLEVPVNGKNKIDVVLEEDAIGIDEVVAIGYGTLRKKDLTGAVSTVDQENFNKGVVVSPEQLLQGKVSGVYITSSSGEPGASQSITIRGPGSIRSGNGPLYVIDGVPLSNDATSPGGVDMGFGNQTAKNPMNFINPNDIESIDVLKDASAAAIYGARGSNGVIIITTKSGKKGSAKVDYSSELSISRVANKIEVLSANKFRDYQNNLNNDQYIGTASTDWQDEIFRRAISQNHKISLSSATETTNYYASLSYFDQEGIIKSSNLDRYTGRINAGQSFWQEKLKINLNLTASVIHDDAVPIGDNPDAGGDLITNALIMNPTYPVKNSDGTYFDQEGSINPVALLDLYTDFTKTRRILGNIDATLKLTKGLSYKINLGIDNTSSSRNTQIDPHNYTGITISPEGRVYISSLENENFLVDNILTYDFNIKDHKLKLMAGHSYQNFNIRSFGFGASNFSTDEIDAIYNPGIGGVVSQSNGDWPSGWARKDELQSFFGRLNYSLHDKYLFTGTLRYDGSSRFGANNKYGTFPSLSAGWRISEEEFMKNIEALSNLKLRAGWGQTGNQEVPSKQTLASVYSGTNSQVGYPLTQANVLPGIIFVRNANPDLKWEVVTQTNIGLDFGFFQGKIYGSVDYFNKVTTDALLEVNITDPLESAGGSTTWKNLSGTEIINKGLDLDLGYQGKSGDFNYTFGANVSFLDNKIKNLQGIYYSGSLEGPGMTSERVLAYIDGESIGSFYLPEFKGLDANGLSVYVGADGSEKYAPDITSDDFKVVGSAIPDFTYNFYGSFDYKGFDLSFNFNGVSGNMIYNNTSNAYFRRQFLDGGNNTAKKLLDDFPNENVTNSDKPSTRYLEDGSYLRLSNATLGYNFKKFNTNYIKNLRVYITGQNLFVITGYSGYDPEVNTNKNISGITSYGIDLSSYPKARTFLFGVNVSF